MAEKKPTMIVCEKCNHEFELAQETLEERPYEAASQGNVTEVVVKCPECATATRCYFNGPRLKQFQARLDMSLKEFQKNKIPSNLKAYRKMLKRYQVEFDRFQKEMTAGNAQQPQEG